MATKLQTLKMLRKLMLNRNISSASVMRKPSGTNAPQKTSAPSPGLSGNVPGLSGAVVSFGKEPVGPGAAKSTDYKNPEYFCYHQVSFAEAEIELAKYRCSQPSSLKK